MLFFFSSRRRHTRSKRDWSSDVCSSDLVFYPVEGVSDMQKRQMITQEGENVNVCAIKGNFDDCQSGVKKIFTDHDVLRSEERRVGTESRSRMMSNESQGTEKEIETERRG